MEPGQHPNFSNFHPQGSNPNHWHDQLAFDWSSEFFDQQSTANEANNNALLDKKKISDALTYGPRFCQIYDKFNKDLNLNIDPSRHLMALCTDYLVSFIKWARESNQQIEWISTTLLDNDYLRPEVRNGVVMVLIYTFASMKATLIEKSDMFITLQDNDQGLGIANKFSLKIYNDPFNYLFFLKTSISALIDAGVIPDNERQNQPKKSKLQYTNHEETESFIKIQKLLLEQLDAGNVPSAKKFVNHISNFWLLRGKFLRNRRFSSALQSLSQSLPVASDLSTILPPVIDPSQNPGLITTSNPTTEPVELGNTTQRTLKRVNSDPIDNNPKRMNLNNDASDDESILENEDDSSPENPAPSQTQEITTPNNNFSTFIPHLLSIPIPVLRFEKIGLQKWQIIETRVFKIDSFLSQLEPYISKKLLKVHLIQAKGIENELQSKLMTVLSNNQSLSLGHLSFEAELIKRNPQTIITTWNYAEISQLDGLLRSWENYNNQQTNNQSQKLLLQFWKDNYESNVNKQNLIDVTRGYLIYESIVQLNMLIRKNVLLGIEEDLWSSLYPEELFLSLGHGNDSSDPSFWKFLLNYFPQLIVLESKLNEMKTSLTIQDRFSLVTIKYYHSHKLSIEDFSQSALDPTSTLLSSPPNSSCYQTLGTLSSPTSKILTRLPQGPFTYDFVLEVIGVKI